MAKRITDEQKEVVIAARQSGESFRKCAEMAGISESAARRICSHEPERSEKEESAEKKGKEKFVENAWEIINGSMALIKDKIAAAAADFGEIKDIIVEVVRGRELKDSEKNKLVFLLENEAKKQVIPTLRELSGVVSVMHEKQALTKGEPTQIMNLSSEDRKLLEVVNDIEKKEQRNKHR